MPVLVTHLECASVSNTDEMENPSGVSRTRRFKRQFRRISQRGRFLDHVDGDEFADVGRLHLRSEFLLVDALTGFSYGSGTV